MSAAGSTPAAGPAPPVQLSGPLPNRSLIEMLLRHPSRFGLDAAVAVMMRASGQPDPGLAVRFEAVDGLAFVGSDLAAVERNEGGDAAGFRVTTGLIGLTGPAGVLPRPYTELAGSQRRQRAPALGAFMNLLGQRPVGQFVEAGIKYRPHRAADRAAIARDVDEAARTGWTPPGDGLRTALASLVGYGTSNLAERLRPGLDPLLHHAGLFAARPRSADRLAALLSDWLGQPVVVEEFAGRWAALEPGQRTALPDRGAIGQFPGQFNRLGIDATIGCRCWDIQSHVVLTIGPLDLPRFEALLPGGQVLPRLIAMARAYLDSEVGFAVRPVLAAAAVPALQLPSALAITPASGPAAARLGRNCWLPTRAPRVRDATEASFSADRGLPMASLETGS